MSFSSSGISIKKSGSADKANPSLKFLDQHVYTGEYSSEKESCCYGKCWRKKCFKGYIICGVVKTKFDNFICVLISLLITCLLIAVITPVILDSVIDSTINQEVVIDSTSASNYQSWQTNINGPGGEIDIGYDIYFFDIQNAEDILSGAKPIVTELGPYAFNEFYYKFDISWSDNGDTVTYNTQRYYIYDSTRTRPGLSSTDELTLPYPTVLGFQYLLGQIPVNASVLVEQFLLNEITTLYQVIEYELQTIDAQVVQIKSAEALYIHKQILALEAQVQQFYETIVSFIEYSNPSELLLKSLLCSIPSGVSPFWKTNIVPAYFGWFNDPLLVLVQEILYKVEATYGISIPWSTAVPGITNNYTSISDTRRRRGMDILKTGKKNPKQVSQYVRYNNMTEYWVCLYPMNSQNTSQYVQGEEFPACAHYQYEWSGDEAEKMGYVKPFVTPYANRVEGSDASMFGRPVTTDKLQVFISDIYRSCYLLDIGDADWYGIKVRRFTIQNKDLQNSTMNPENAQYYNIDAPSGMENLTAATGVPSWASFPNFLNADPTLVAAVLGVSPNPDIHSSYLDIEPQTGLLVRAEKKLQVNYQMTTQTFPNLPNTTAETLHEICVNYASILKEIESQGVHLNISIPYCNNTEIQSLLTCLSVDSDWKYQNNQVFMPYAWVEEHFVLSESDANDLQESLFSIQTFASTLQYWCLIVSATLFCMIATALYTKSYVIHNLANKTQSYYEPEMIIGESSHPMVGGYHSDTPGKI